MTPDPRFLGDAQYGVVRFHITDVSHEFFERYPLGKDELYVYITPSDDIGDLNFDFCENRVVWIDFDEGKGRRAKALLRALCSGYRRPKMILTDLGEGLESYDPWSNEIKPFFKEHKDAGN